MKFGSHLWLTALSRVFMWLDTNGQISATADSTMEWGNEHIVKNISMIKVTLNN